VTGRWLIAGAVAASLVGSCTCSGDSDSGGIPGIKTASAACKRASDECLPEVTFVDTDGRAITPEELSGKVVAVNFWATWCGPCKSEIPTLTRLYERYRERGFVLLGVMNDDVDNSELEAFARQYGLRYPVIRLDYDVGDAFGLPAGFPTTYIYDRSGHLRYDKMGAVREREIEQLLGDLLADPVPK